MRNEPPYPPNPLEMSEDVFREWVTSLPQDELNELMALALK